MSGRGAWPISGKGGTLDADGENPGPYYVLSQDGRADSSGWVGRGDFSDVNVLAVHGGVRAIQGALNRRMQGLGLKVDGLFGPATSRAVKSFQDRKDLMVDGVLGRITAKALFQPDIRNLCAADDKFTPAYVVCGIISHESAFDPGAVGSVDEHDLGLAQINGPAHPSLSAEERLDPLVAIGFVISYLANSLDAFDGNLRDAVASYNLGIGGARSWIKAGRPDVWAPTSTSKPRNVKAYIDGILTACK